MSKRKSTRVVLQLAEPEPEHVTIQKTVDFCRRPVKQTAQAWIKIGCRLQDLKVILQSDEHKWRAAFGEGRNRRRIADNAFPFSSRTADMLIKVYHRFALGGTAFRTPALNAFNAERLPPHWGTLYELSLFTNDELIASKEKIRPRMTREHARRLRAKDKSAANRKPDRLPID